MQDNSSASAGRWAQAIFIFNSLELAASMTVSKQETKSIHAIAGKRAMPISTTSSGNFKAFYQTGL